MRTAISLRLAAINLRMGRVGTEAGAEDFAEGIDRERIFVRTRFGKAKKKRSQSALFWYKTPDPSLPGPPGHIWGDGG